MNLCLFLLLVQYTELTSPVKKVLIYTFLGHKYTHFSSVDFGGYCLGDQELPPPPPTVPLSLLLSGNGYISVWMLKCTFPHDFPNVRFMSEYTLWRDGLRKLKIILSFYGKQIKKAGRGGRNSLQQNRFLTGTSLSILINLVIRPSPLRPAIHMPTSTSKESAH